MIDIVINESLINHVNEYDGVLVSTNCYQVMRNGFQFEVAKHFPYVKEMNYQTNYGDITKLGTILECKENNQPLFILLFTTFGYNFKGNDKDFFDYDALVKCLKLINILYKGSHLATTMLGCTCFDGNADKNKIIEIVNNEVKDFDLTIYDYRQESHRTFKRREYFESLKKRYEKNKERSKLGRKVCTKTKM
jgi:hypothetical protein